MEEAKTKTKDLACKVSKMMDATDKIASNTNLYWDVLMARPAASNRTFADPKVLSDMDRKARQILVKHLDQEGINTLAKSLTKLVSKANEVLASIKDTTKPKDAKVVTVTKTKNQMLLLTLDSKATAEWIRELLNEILFIDAFSKGVHIRERTYNLVVPRVLITFDPKNEEHLHEVEEINSLDNNELHKVK